MVSTLPTRPFTLMSKPEFIEMVFRRLMEAGWPTRMLHQALRVMWSGNLSTTRMILPSARFVQQMKDALDLSLEEQRLWRYHFDGGD